EISGARVIEIGVNGGFHSPLMDLAKERFKEFTDTLKFKQAKVPIVSNVTARAHTDKDEIKNNIVEQLTSPVLWRGCVEFMIKEGVDTFFEIGPSGILNGLIKRINPHVKIINIEKKEDLDMLDLHHRISSRSA
ncbi:MAG: ACP S-malonyltransferase, partial [bacterium]